MPKHDVPVILALDPSTQCGCAVGPAGDRPLLWSVSFGRSAVDAPEEIYGVAADFMFKSVISYQPALVAIEQPFNRTDGETNYGTTVLLQGIYAVLVGVARQLHIKVIPVMVQSWRSVTLGTSRLGGRDAAKRAMMAQCRALGWDAVDDNAADAAGIHIWASAKHVPYGVMAEGL